MKYNTYPEGYDSQLDATDYNIENTIINIPHPRPNELYTSTDISETYSALYQAHKRLYDYNSDLIFERDMIKNDYEYLARENQELKKKVFDLQRCISYIGNTLDQIVSNGATDIKEIHSDIKIIKNYITSRTQEILTNEPIDDCISEDNIEGMLLHLIKNDTTYQDLDKSGEFKQ